jgi:arginase family enzyme
MDLGQNRRGVDMGPSALRVAEVQARDLGFEGASCEIIDQGRT